jgi:hypothetical protein
MRLRFVDAMLVARRHLSGASQLFAWETAGALLAKLSPVARQKALVSEESGREFRQIFLVGR